MVMENDLDRKFMALADPTRRAILAHLAEGERSVSELAAPFAMSQPAISKHLRLLEEAGLVVSGRDGQRRPRRLDPKGLAPARDFIEQMASYWPDRFDRLAKFLNDEGKTA